MANGFPAERRIELAARAGRDDNQFHDRLVKELSEAVPPLPLPETVLPRPDGVLELRFPVEVTAALRNKVVTLEQTFQSTAREGPPNLKALADDYRAALAATNLPAAAKDALGVKLLRLIRAVAIGHRGDTNGPA